MKISAWNLRGVGSTIKTRELSLFLSEHKPSIMIIIDPKLSTEGINRFKLKFPSFNILSNDNVQGPWASILLLWKHEDVVLVSHTMHHAWIRGNFHMATSGELFSVSGVYLAPDFQIRRYQFLDLQSDIQSCSCPLINLGDFNSVCNAMEKTGRSPSSASCATFLNFIDATKLVELKDACHSFSWSNNRIGQANIMCLLDRAFFNHAWVDSFWPHSTVSLLPRTVSDHSPIIADLGVQVSSSYGKPLFKFYSYWQEIEECRAMLQSSWNIRVKGCPLVRFQSRLQAYQSSFT